MKLKPTSTSPLDCPKAITSWPFFSYPPMVTEPELTGKTTPNFGWKLLTLLLISNVLIRTATFKWPTIKRPVLAIYWLICTQKNFFRSLAKGNGCGILSLCTHRPGSLNATLGYCFTTKFVWLPPASKIAFVAVQETQRSFRVWWILYPWTLEWEVISSCNFASSASLAFSTSMRILHGDTIATKSEILFYSGTPKLRLSSNLSGSNNLLPPIVGVEILALLGDGRLWHYHVFVCVEYTEFEQDGSASSPDAELSCSNSFRLGACNNNTCFVLLRCLQESLDDTLYYGLCRSSWIFWMAFDLYQWYESSR